MGALDIESNIYHWKHRNKGQDILHNRVTPTCAMDYAIYQSVIFVDSPVSLSIKNFLNVGSSK